MTRKNIKKRKKLSIKKLLIFFIPLILIITILINKNQIKCYYLSKKTGYQEKTIEVFLDKNIYQQIKKEKYSKTLDNIINSEYYNPKYLDSYININYLEKENFFKNINSLLDLGYTDNDINNIYAKLNNESINIIIQNQYIKDITNIINLSYFKESYLERYIKYLEKDTNNEIDTSVTYVNIGLDNDYYTNVSKITNQEDILVLVNKYHVLESNYEPNDLEAISSKYNRSVNGKLRKVAKEAFEKMCESAKKDNITIYNGSGYRSYNYQKSLYNRYVSIDGLKAAETYSARPGYSEHQTGLALDIMNGRGSFISHTDKEYTWLINNSYKYGFILRYPKGKENITGYMYEEWHFRYLGLDVAKKVYDSNITYDEYIAKNN